MWAVKCSPRWHIPPRPGRGSCITGTSEQADKDQPWRRFSKGLLKPGLTQRPPTPSSPTPFHCLLPKSRTAGMEQPRPPRDTGAPFSCCSIPGQPAGPRGGQGSIVPGAERGLLPALLEHGALRLTWPPQGKFQNFPSWDHMSRARRAGQVGASEPRCLTHAVPVNPHRAARDGGLAPGGSGTDPDPPPPTPARGPWCSCRGRSGMRLPRVSLRVLAARGSVLWLISSAS